MEMKPFFQFDTEALRHSLMARARQVALSALQRYDVPWEKIRYIGISDTITYKIETGTAEAYLLRIHSDRMSRAEIHSELEFLQALSRSEDLSLPIGVASREGSYVLEMETEAGYYRPHVTMMRWVDGEHASTAITEDQAYLMGQLMGRLHKTAADFVPSSAFVRPTWDADSFRGKMERLERYHACFLSCEGWEMYQTAAEKIILSLSKMHTGVHHYGLIHGDLHPGNIVFKDGMPYPIDFGMCGYGFFLYDMAGALVGLHTKPRRMFIKGYKSVSPLETDYIRDLELFFIMFMIENYCHHASDPRETDSLIQEQPLAQAYIRAYLKGESFLLDPIEPVTVNHPSQAGNAT